MSLLRSGRVAAATHMVISERYGRRGERDCNRQRDEIAPRIHSNASLFGIEPGLFGIEPGRGGSRST
jgi:hypothetical protein